MAAVAREAAAAAAAVVAAAVAAAVNEAVAVAAVAMAVVGLQREEAVERASIIGGAQPRYCRPTIT